MVGRVVGQRIAIAVYSGSQRDGQCTISAEHGTTAGDIDAVDDQAGDTVVASRDRDGARRGFGSASRSRTVGQRRFVDLGIAREHSRC